MLKNKSISCNSMEEIDQDKEKTDDDMDSKIKELLKFQYNMIEKLDEVLKKLDNIHI